MGVDAGLKLGLEMRSREDQKISRKDIRRSGKGRLNGIAKEYIINLMTKEEKRLNDDFNWLVKNMSTIQKKSTGKFIAVINKHIAGIGKSAKEAYQKAKKAYPDKEPLLDLVPTKEFLLL